MGMTLGCLILSHNGMPQCHTSSFPMSEAGIMCLGTIVVRCYGPWYADSRSGSQISRRCNLHGSVISSLFNPCWIRSRQSWPSIMMDGGPHEGRF
ncbi:hypothetical protein BDW59DRAFT_54328 [Aspergillus cavernicola]|uniref:Uncharacterized protein n=1 Tax=Aspergillus cavernicola TaxID=176166 RepID=A0ABR4IKE5_9EURO